MGNLTGLIKARLQFLTKESTPGNFEKSEELKSLIETVLTKIQIKGWLWLLEYRVDRVREQFTSVKGSFLNKLILW